MADDVAVETTTCIFAQFDDFVAVQVVQMRALHGPSTLPFLDSILDFNSHPRFVSRMKFHQNVCACMEEYFQEAGIAGRDGLPARAHVFFNSHDISKGRKQLSDVMRKYVKDKRCKREIILNYFRFNAPTRSGPLHECFDFHQNVWACDECVISSVSTVFEERSIQDDI